MARVGDLRLHGLCAYKKQGDVLVQNEPKGQLCITRILKPISYKHIHDLCGYSFTIPFQETGSVQTASEAGIQS